MQKGSTTSFDQKRTSEESEQSEHSSITDHSTHQIFTTGALALTQGRAPCRCGCRDQLSGAGDHEQHLSCNALVGDTMLGPDEPPAMMRAVGIVDRLTMGDGEHW